MQQIGAGGGMMYGVVLVIHVVVALFLIIVILVQGGRGGLGEALGGAGAQSLFGGGANVVMTKVTAIGAALFMVTCLSLAALSTARGRSVIDQLSISPDALPFAPSQVPESIPEPIEAEEGTADSLPAEAAAPAASPEPPTAVAPSPVQAVPAPADDVP